MSSVVLFGGVLVHLLLMLLPMAACILVAQRFGVTNRVLQVMCAVAGSGLLGFATFWAYLLSASFGRGFAIALDVACALVLLDACRSRFARWRDLSVFAPVTALFASAGLFYLALGYLYGGLNGKGEIASNRFLTGLPGDSYIPMLFAQQLQNPHRPLPNFIMGHFQSSDRPPLQTGYYLMQQALLGNGRFFDYQVMGTLAQGVWIFALWAFMRAARQHRWATSLCLAAVLFSGFAIVNSFFTWPKMLAGACVLLSCAVLLTPELRAARGSRTAGALTGATLGCAMLGHPGSVFVLAAILLALLMLRYLPSWRFLSAGTVAMAVAYLPWTMYTKYYQPPGNALIDLQLADAPPSKPGQSTTSVIIEAYRKLSPHQILANKWSNFTTPFDHTLGYLRQGATLVAHAFSGSTPQLAAQSRAETGWLFFYVGPTLGLVGWGLAILVLRGGWNLYQRVAHRGSAPRADAAGRPSIVVLGLLSLAITYVLWALTLLGPRGTIVHQGSYFVELIAMALGIMGWWSVSRRATAIVVVVSAVFTVYLYLRYTPWATGPGTPFTHGVSSSIALLLAFSILACAGSLWWVGVRREGEVRPDGSQTGQIGQSVTLDTAAEAAAGTAGAVPEGLLGQVPSPGKPDHETGSVPL